MPPRRLRPFRRAKPLKLPKSYIAVLLISIIAGGIVYAYNNGFVVPVVPPETYSVTINAYCTAESQDVSVAISSDVVAGTTTPHTFSGLTSTHTFTVPTTDANLHPFSKWDNGQTSTALTVSSGGTFTAQYGSPVPPPPLSWKTHPLIIGWYVVIATDRPPGSVNGNPTDAEMEADVANMKSLGMTAILPANQDLGDRLLKLIQVCQSQGMYVILCANFALAETSDSAAHLQAMANSYRSYSNVIGIWFDDWGERGGAALEPTWDSWVRANFDLGRSYFIMYGASNNQISSSTTLKGKTLTSLTVYVYYGESDYNTAAWVDTAYQKYGGSSADASYSTGILFDAQDGDISTFSTAMWGVQADRAIQYHMLVYMWFIWNYYCWPARPSTNIMTHPEWWPTIAQVDQKLLAFLQQP